MKLAALIPPNRDFFIATNENSSASAHDIGSVLNDGLTILILMKVLGHRSPRIVERLPGGAFS
jgi:hypothetical protein